MVKCGTGDQEVFSVVLHFCFVFFLQGGPKKKKKKKRKKKKKMKGGINGNNIISNPSYVLVHSIRFVTVL